MGEPNSTRTTPPRSTADAAAPLHERLRAVRESIAEMDQGGMRPTRKECAEMLATLDKAGSLWREALEAAAVLVESGTPSNGTTRSTQFDRHIARVLADKAKAIRTLVPPQQQRQDSAP